MSYFRVTAGVADVPIDDLGIVIPASATVVLSNQFSIDDLYLSADLEALIIATTLDVEIDYGTGFAAILAADYTNRDALAAFLNVYEITNENNNEDLVDGSEVNSSGPASAPLHIHDARYFTETELGDSTVGSPGAGLIGANDDSWQAEFTFTTVQEFIDDIYTWLTSTGVDLDAVYTNDADGIMNVNGTTKPLELKSDGLNDIIISRFSTPDLQDALRFDVSIDELILGSAAVGGLNPITVRVPYNLIVDGNVTFTGTVTDTTTDELNVTNANIRLRDGATAIAGADAYIEVERGTSGADAQLLWSHSATRWMIGIVGDMATAAGLEWDELVTGVWEFQGGATTDPNMYLTDKSAAPSTSLGSAGQIPIAMINNLPAYYDRTRTKWLGYSRQFMTYTGRDNTNNKAEYARVVSAFTSNQSGIRLSRAMTLIGMTIQTSGAMTWTARVRKNGSPTNLASLAASAVDGAKTTALDVDFAADDWIMVYIDSTTNVDRPVIELEFAPKF